MNARELIQLRGFYENELTNRILSFWLPRCRDNEHGGFVNCFTNRGDKLMARDKYTWSQGRFVWMFSRLSTTKAPIFDAAQRKHFLSLAKNGADFLMQHCLLPGELLRCTFLMEADGTPKYVAGCDTLDMSIYADCFVVLGLSAYSVAANDRAAYDFARKLYHSIRERFATRQFHTLPYPLSSGYRQHGESMIMSNVTKEMHDAAAVMDKAFLAELEENLAFYTSDILEHFTDENNVIHEIITKDNTFFPDLLGQQANPGHTIEDMWFMIDAADILHKPEMVAKAAAIAKKALKIGWDEEFGGILHYASPNGGQPAGDPGATADEPMTKQLSGWGDKLWWIHSEALYTTLLCHLRTGDPEFLAWHDKVFDYTFSVFPNPDPEIREWIQILTREGRPQDKVVALPVKDPYHITRNLLLLVELLYERSNNAKP